MSPPISAVFGSCSRANSAFKSSARLDLSRVCLCPSSAFCGFLGVSKHRMVSGSNRPFGSLQIRVTDGHTQSHDRPALALLGLPILWNCARIDGLSGLGIDVGRQATLSTPATHHVPTLTMVHPPEQLRSHMFTAIVTNDHRHRNCEYE